MVSRTGTFQSALGITDGYFKLLCISGSGGVRYTLTDLQPGIPGRQDVPLRQTLNKLIERDSDE